MLVRWRVGDKLIWTWFELEGPYHKPLIFKNNLKTGFLQIIYLNKYLLFIYLPFLIIINL